MYPSLQPSGAWHSVPHSQLKVLPTVDSKEKENHI